MRRSWFAPIKTVLPAGIYGGGAGHCPRVRSAYSTTRFYLAIAVNSIITIDLISPDSKNNRPQSENSGGIKFAGRDKGKIEIIS